MSRLLFLILISIGVLQAMFPNKDNKYAKYMPISGSAEAANKIKIDASDIHFSKDKGTPPKTNSEQVKNLKET